MVSRLAFVALVVLVAAQRLAELRRSAQNERWLRAAGAVEAAPRQMPVMRALHAAWLICALLEVLLVPRDPSLYVAIAAGFVFAIGQGLRLAAMHALGTRWNVKVLVLPGWPPIRTGIFRYLRHPNYVGVTLEIAALPMIGGAWMTALAFTVANGGLLVSRILAEERALTWAADAPA